MGKERTMQEKPYLFLSTNVAFSYDRSPVPAQFERHFHNVYELLYIIRGAGQVIIEGARYDMRPGAIALFRPGEFHYVQPDPKTPYERCVIHFPADLFGDHADAVLRSFKKNAPDSGIFYDAAEIDADLRRTFERLRLAEELPDDQKAAMRCFLIGQLLLLLVLLPLPAAGNVDALGARAIRYLGAHITEHISLDTLARELLVSKYYLCRAFKQYNGISVQNYLSEKRILLAKEKIAAGMKPGVAAEEAGFSDYSSFYRTFKKITGHAPKEELRS